MLSGTRRGEHLIPLKTGDTFQRKGNLVQHFPNRSKQKGLWGDRFWMCFFLGKVQGTRRLKKTFLLRTSAEEPMDVTVQFPKVTVSVKRPFATRLWMWHFSSEIRWQNKTWRLKIWNHLKCLTSWYQNHSNLFLRCEMHHEYMAGTDDSWQNTQESWCPFSNC